jgi:ABC-2 type transport system permease protein
MTTAVAIAPVARPTVRSTGASFPKLVGLEIRKSLSTRSGKALAVAALLLAPIATLLASLASAEELGSAVGPIAVMGLLTAYVLVSLGVLSTAGEWSHGTVQTTFLLTPSRGRVLASKAVAVALLGAVFTAIAATLSAGVLSVLETGVSWDGAPRALIAVVAAGAALAVTGAGVGAALGNTPGSLTGLYLVILGVMPVLENVKPALAEKIDPANSVLNLAQGQEQATAIAVLAGWVVIASVAGWILTHRRAVQ